MAAQGLRPPRSALHPVRPAASCVACAQRDWGARETMQPLALRTDACASHETSAELDQHGAPFASAAHQSTASISRIASPHAGARLRSMLSHRHMGPTSVVLVAGYCSSLLFAAWRFFIVSRTRSCEACQGYGLLRCDFCQGAGMVAWSGKWGHQEPCPRCVGKRHMRCRECGGWHHRSLFNHVPRHFGMDCDSAQTTGQYAPKRDQGEVAGDMTSE